MNRQEHLLTILGEEGVEVAQRCSKALRFGLGEVQPGQELNNAARIRGEYIDLLAVMRMLVEEGAIAPVTDDDLPAMEEKRQKVEKFLEYSRQCGTLTADPVKPGSFGVPLVTMEPGDERCDECDKGFMRPASGGGVKCDQCDNWFCY